MTDPERADLDFDDPDLDPGPVENGEQPDCEECASGPPCFPCWEVRESALRVVIVGERLNLDGVTWRPRDPARETDLRFLFRLGAFRSGKGRGRLLDAGVRWHRSANLLMPGPPGAWDARRARETADAVRADLLREADLIVLLGVRVRDAFRFRGGPGPRRLDDSFLLLPHPSGRCFYWNGGEEAASLVRTTFREALRGPGSFRDDREERSHIMAKSDKKNPQATQAQKPAGGTAAPGEKKLTARQQRRLADQAAKAAGGKTSAQLEKEKFDALPAHLQLAERLKTTAARVALRLKRIVGWRAEVQDGQGNPADAAAQARAALTSALQQIDASVSWLTAIPADWKAGPATPKGKALKKTPEKDDICALRGGSAKQEPKLAENEVRVLEVIPGKHPRARILCTEDGQPVRLNVPITDLRVLRAAEQPAT